MVDIDICNVSEIMLNEKHAITDYDFFDPLGNRTMNRDSEHSRAYLDKVEQLEKRYSTWRKIRGDGNCYYRCVIFATLEQILCVYWSCWEEYVLRFVGDVTRPEGLEQSFDDDMESIYVPGDIALLGLHLCNSMVQNILNSAQSAHGASSMDDILANTNSPSRNTDSNRSSDYIHIAEIEYLTKCLREIFPIPPDYTHPHTPPSTGDVPGSIRQVDRLSMNLVRLQEMMNTTDSSGLSFDSILVRCCRWQVATYLMETHSSQEEMRLQKERGDPSPMPGVKEGYDDDADSDTTKNRKEPEQVMNEGTDVLLLEDIVMANFGMGIGEFVNVSCPTASYLCVSKHVHISICQLYVVHVCSSWNSFDV